MIVPDGYCIILICARSGTLFVVRESVHCKVTTTASVAWVSVMMLCRSAQVLGTRW
jgi:hypothetical protein